VSLRVPSRLEEVVGLRRGGRWSGPNVEEEEYEEEEEERVGRGPRRHVCMRHHLPTPPTSGVKEVLFRVPSVSSDSCLALVTSLENQCVPIF
jgi:hypothetical protein